MRRLLAIFCSGAALLLAPHAAHADIDWSYQGDTEVKITSGGSVLTFWGSKGSAGNSTGVVLYNMTASSTTANNGPPDHFDATPFTLTVDVTDDLALAKSSANHTGSLKFMGFFTGDMSKGMLNNWSVTWLKDEGSVELGDAVSGTRRFDVKIDGFLPPSPNNPTANGLGVIHADVIATSLTNGITDTPNPTDTPEIPEPTETPEPSETPEPASLLLAGIALTGIGASRWRKRQAKKRKV